MNTEALFLFLILLLGLLLCSFLGGNCGKEGFSDNNNTQPLTTSNSSSSQSFFGSLFTPPSNNYDNYNHYTGSGSSTQLQNGMTFNDPSGNTITVIPNSNGSQNLQLNTVGESIPMILSSTPPTNSNIQIQPNTFYAPYGGVTATIITDNNNQTAIQVTIGSNTILFTQLGGNSANNISSTQYYGSTGYPIPQASSATSYTGPYGGNAGSVSGPAGNTAYYAQGPNGNGVAGVNPYYNSNQYYGPYSGSAGSVTGPAGNTAYYAQGPNGNTVAGTTNTSGYNYSSSLPPGIPASQIPPGQQDLYILKSEIVPPVCPACPTSAACPRQEPCPACPPCGRCPEPAFECKKVPNYNAIDNQYLPQPVLNDFSQFGM